MKDVREAVEYLHGLRSSGVKLGLENMQRLCEEYAHPHAAYPIIHVAGTNGKGSVVAMLESIFMAAGIRCAAFTSPHLMTFNERLRVDGVPISDQDLITEVTELKGKLEALQAQGHSCTFFEATNAMAFSYFRKARVEIAVIETGLGGRLDSSNVVDPLISVITSIGMDHQEWLGDTLEQIAAEKAGIIKPGKPVVVGLLQESCLEVIKKKAEVCGAEMITTEQWSSVAVDKQSMSRIVCGVGREWELSLVSQAQLQNASTVYSITRFLTDRGWKISDESVATGFKRTSWPARFQRIHSNPEVILDGAHNAAAMHDLLHTWKEFYGDLPRVVAIGCLRKKLTEEFIQALRSLLQGAFCCYHLEVQDERSAPFEEFQQVVSANPKIRVEAMDLDTLFRDLAGGSEGQPWLICGSLYLAGDVLARLSDQTFQPEING